MAKAKAEFQVNVCVADLFAGLDHGKIGSRGKNNLSMGDLENLQRKAVWFCNTLEALGVYAGQPTQVVDDFLNRL